MSKGHATREIGKDREQNLKNPALPNTTKVVRLVIVPPGRSIASTRSPTRTDVFVVTDEEGKLHPKTWLGDGLVDHEEAHHQHRGTVLIVKGLDRDQIEWQCDVPFRVSQIEKTAGHALPEFQRAELSIHDGPGPPDGTARRSGAANPIRSRKSDSWYHWQAYRMEATLQGALRVEDRQDVEAIGSRLLLRLAVDASARR